MSETNPENTPQPEKEPIAANGNQIIKTLSYFPGEGLIIRWVREDFLSTMIDEVGVQKPLFDFVSKQFPDPKEATGRGLSIVSKSDGSPIQVGQISSGKNQVSIEKELRELGLLD